MTAGLRSPSAKDSRRRVGSNFVIGLLVSKLLFAGAVAMATAPRTPPRSFPHPQMIVQQKVCAPLLDVRIRCFCHMFCEPMGIDVFAFCRLFPGVIAVGFLSSLRMANVKLRPIHIQ